MDLLYFIDESVTYLENDYYNTIGVVLLFVIKYK